MLFALRLRTQEDCAVTTPRDRKATEKKSEEVKSKPHGTVAKAEIADFKPSVSGTSR
jgi:hypothetical protein